MADNVSENLKRTGQFPRADLSRLYVRDLVRGSMGFILEEAPSEQPNMFASPLKVAVEEATELMTGLSDDREEVFAKTLRVTSGRVLLAIKNLAEVLNDARATTEILGDERALSLGDRKVDLLVGRLSDLSVDEVPSVVEGLLLGILPGSHQFEFQPIGDGELLRGTISEEVAVAYRSGRVAGLLLKPVEASLTTVQTTRGELVLKEQLVLEGVRLTGESSSGV